MEELQSKLVWKKGHHMVSYGMFVPYVYDLSSPQTVPCLFAQFSRRE